MSNFLEQLKRPRTILTLRIGAGFLITVGATLLITAPAPESEAGFAVEETTSVEAAPELESAKTPAAELPIPPPPIDIDPQSEISGTSRTVVIRAEGGEKILHDYQDSLALLVGRQSDQQELEEIGTLFNQRGFRIKQLSGPTLSELTSEIASLSKDSTTPREKRRILLYLSGETIDAGGRNEIFYRTVDTPEGELDPRKLRAAAYPLDDLRYLASDLEGSPLLVVVNSGFRALFLEETGQAPAFLNAESFSDPAPFFIVAESNGGRPVPGFPQKFIQAFRGGADSDGDRQVSSVELARFMSGPAYLAAMVNQSSKGPGMVFDLPADAVVKKPARVAPISAPEPPRPATSEVQTGVVAKNTSGPAAPSSAVQAVPGQADSQKQLLEESMKLPPLAENVAPKFGQSFQNKWGIPMVSLKPGSFTHSYPSALPSAAPLPPSEKIEIASFWLSRNEITSEQYAKVMGETVDDAGNIPRQGVTWIDANAFCERLTSAAVSTGSLPEGYVYRLPYEIEWEFASTEGPTRFRKPNLLPGASWAGQLSPIAPVADSEEPSSPEQILAITTGLMEWCLDVYVSGPDETRSPPPSPTARVVRGGLIGNPMDRLATRFGVFGEDESLPFIGFRVALAPAVIDIPAMEPPAPLIEPDTILTRDELFDESPYADWDSYNKSAILKKAQTAFKDLELYEAKVDGAAGPSTQKAINQYQSDNRLPVTGRLDAPTLSALELTEETKKKAPPSGPWWVTRPSYPRNGDPEPPKSKYHYLGRIKLMNDKNRDKLDKAEYRKYEIYSRWEDAQD